MRWGGFFLNVYDINMLGRSIGHNYRQVYRGKVQFYYVFSFSGFHYVFFFLGN